MGGTDAALFNINASTGAVTFKAAPNFEILTDAGANNVYAITFTTNVRLVGGLWLLVGYPFGFGARSRINSFEGGAA